MDSLNEVQDAKAQIKHAMNITQKDVWRLHDNVMGRLAETQRRARRRSVMKRTAVAAFTAVAALYLTIGLQAHTGVKTGQEKPADPTEKWMVFDVPQTGYNLLEGPNSNVGEGVANASKNGYATRVDKSATDQGITITVGNVYAEQGYVAFDLVESFDSNLAEKPVFDSRNLKIWINDKPVVLHQGSGGELKLSGNRFGLAFAFNPDVMPDVPEQFTLRVAYDKIGDVKGTWSIQFPVSRQKADQATKTWEPGSEVISKDARLKVEKVKMTPAHLFVDYKLTLLNDQTPLQDLNNLGIIAFDDKGKFLGLVAEPQAVGNGKEIELRGEYASPAAVPNALSFEPIIGTEQKEADKMKMRVPLASSKPIVFQLDACKKVSVTAVERLQGKLRLHLEASDAEFTSLLLKNFNSLVYLERTGGKKMVPVSAAVPVSSDGRQFVQDFKVSPEQAEDLYVTASPWNDLPELELYNVPLR